jgi:hypothetical protein
MTKIAIIERMNDQTKCLETLKQAFSQWHKIYGTAVRDFKEFDESAIMNLSIEDHESYNTIET